jgi:hypothetical protein
MQIIENEKWEDIFNCQKTTSGLAILAYLFTEKNYAHIQMHYHFKIYIDIAKASFS